MFVSKISRVRFKKRKNKNEEFHPRHEIPKLREPRFLCRKHDTRMHLGSTPVTLTRRTNKANASHESRSESARYALVIQPARRSAVSDGVRPSPATLGGVRESPQRAGAVGAVALAVRQEGRREQRVRHSAIISGGAQFSDPPHRRVMKGGRGARGVLTYCEMPAR